MKVRRSTIFLTGTTAFLALFLTLLLSSRFAAEAALPALSRKAELVRSLELTDLCLFTEASYTRHLAMTDLNAPFQDAPVSFEHFPTGALAGPPARLTRSHGRND